MAFTEIKTQEEFDAAIKERLERERAKFADYDELKKRAGEADGYKKQLDAANGALEKLKAEAKEAADKLANHDKEVSDLTTRATKAERSLLCRKIAEEAHLPTAFADRLTGESEDDLRKDAKTLAQYVHTTTAPLSSAEKPVVMGEAAKTAALNEAYSGLLTSLKGE